MRRSTVGRGGRRRRAFPPLGLRHVRSHPLRRRLGAAALGAAGVLVAASLALKVVDTEDPRALLEAIAAAPDRFAAGTLLQLAAAACLLAALPVFLWLLRGRGGRLGAAAIGLLYASTLGNVGDAGASAYRWAAATDGVSAADVAIVERAQESAAGVAVSLLVVVGLLGFRCSPPRCTAPGPRRPPCRR